MKQEEIAVATTDYFLRILITGIRGKRKVELVCFGGRIGSAQFQGLVKY